MASLSIPRHRHRVLWEVGREAQVEAAVPPQPREQGGQWCAGQSPGSGLRGAPGPCPSGQLSASPPPLLRQALDHHTQCLLTTARVWIPHLVKGKCFYENGKFLQTNLK